MIKKPTEMDFKDKNIILIISGLPGVGKTTLALSAPDVLLIDADEGMVRVNPEHRRDSSLCKTYEEILADIEAAEGNYKTIVIDTCGALIEMMKDWAIRTDPKASKPSGGLSIQGFGTIKSEFVRLSSELRRKFNVIFLFHENKSKENEDIFFDIVCEGATKTLVWQPADLGAHLHIVNGDRYLGFTPTMNYNAKSAYGIKGLVKVPELKKGDPNNFLTVLFDAVKNNIAEQDATAKLEEERYDAVMNYGKRKIEELTKPEDALTVLNNIRKADHALTSLKELEAMFKEHVAEKKWAYDAKVKAYVSRA